MALEGFLLKGRIGNVTGEGEGKGRIAAAPTRICSQRLNVALKQIRKYIYSQLMAQERTRDDDD